MVYRIRKKDKTLKGTVGLTSSKSISNRVLIIRALCGKQFSISNLATANDTKLLQELLNSTDEIINAEDAGTTFRFLTAFLAQKPGEWTLTGTQRMKERPVGILVDALRSFGAEISYTEKENFPPVKISGRKLQGGKLNMNSSMSSQFISALLLIAPTLEEGLDLKLAGEIFSRPYIELTLSLMNQFGIQSEWNENIISVKHEEYRPSEIIIENDWSAASYWYEMAALSDDVDLILKGLNQNSFQGDSAIVNIMEQFGIRTEFVQDVIRITKKNIPGIEASSIFKHNFQSHPDLFPSIAVTCAALNMNADFTGVQNLRIKESNRLESVQSQLKKIGINSEISDFGFRISDTLRNKPDSSALLFQTYNDHRLAMSFAPLAIKYGSVEIENPEVVKKSYPEFWDDLRSVGFLVEEINF
jgi:3-phosphoshikimate 1-carboxyvinyltransferase